MDTDPDSNRLRLQRRLAEELARMADVQAIALIGGDGTVIAAGVPEGADVQALSRSVDLVASARSVLHALDRGSFHQVFARGEHGYVVATMIDARVVFVASISAKSKLALMLMDLQRTARELAPLL